MQKALLYSLLFVTLLVPIAAARRRSRAEGLRQALATMGAFSLLYLVFLLYIFPMLDR
jgi:hypothetical protein